MNAAANMLRSALGRATANMSSGIPKRPPTSYMLFAKAQRAAGAVDATLKVPEQGKAIGAAWRALADKSPYEAESLRLREAYAAEVKAYTETHGSPPPSKKALKQSQPKKKRAPSAYVPSSA